MIVHVNHSIRFMLLFLGFWELWFYFIFIYNNQFAHVNIQLDCGQWWWYCKHRGKEKKLMLQIRSQMVWDLIFHLKQAIQMIFNLRFGCSVHEKFRLIFKHRNSLFDNSHLWLALICNFLIMRKLSNHL